MEDVTDISDLLERCKDRAFMNNNRDRIKECILRQPLRDQARGLLGSKKNIFVLRLIEAIGIPVDGLLPSLEDKRNINQHVYSTYYYLYKTSIIDDGVFERARDYFKCMRNYEKMFVDTESSFIISRIEADRRRHKAMKRELNKVAGAEEELQLMLAELPEIGVDEVVGTKNISSVRSTFVIDVDPVFDTGGLRGHAKEDGARKISEIRDGLFCLDNTYLRFNTLGTVGERWRDGRPEQPRDGRYHRFERILHEVERSKHASTPLFYAIDRLAGSRITRLYGAIVRLQKMHQRVYLVSRCPLSQVLAELLFFEYFDADMRNVVSVTGAAFDVYQEIRDTEGIRVVVVCDETDDPLWRNASYRMGYGSLEKMVDMMLRSRTSRWSVGRDSTT